MFNAFMEKFALVYAVIFMGGIAILKILSDLTTGINIVDWVLFTGTVICMIISLRLLRKPK